MSGMKIDPNLKQAGAYEEYDRWVRHNKITGALAAGTALTTLPLIYPLHTVLVDGFTSENFQAAGSYFKNIGHTVIGDIPVADFLHGYYGSWFAEAFAGNVPPSPMWLAWLGIPAVIGLAGYFSNPHGKTPNIYGDTRWADEGDLKRMGDKNRVGHDKSLFVVGKKDKKLIKMGETLSILLLAPPGTGKTVGFIVPSAVAMDESSLFLHDQKPELFDMTSGHRSTVGPVYQLKWSAQDEPHGTWIDDEKARLLSPDLLELDENGQQVRNEDGLIKTKPIYYPSWNVLSPKCIPGPGPKRDMYIDRLVNVLCPDPPTGKDFWVSKARAALIGLITFLVAKVEAALDPNMGHSWNGIPEHWRGREASFPMLVDWFAMAQNDIEDGSDDPIRELMKALIEESKQLDRLYHEKYGLRPMNRSIVELTNLAAAPDKTRGSILTTLDEALNPFKNESVRQRTSSCDFAFYDLRGKPVPEAYEREMKKVAAAKAQGKQYKPRYAKEEFRPVTIYISINAEDAKAFASITGIFVDSANAYLVANGPNTTDDQGNQLGPYAFGFLLDEMPQLPKLDTVVNGPSVGRSKKVFYILVGQDFGQIEQKYSKPDVEVLKSTTAIKIVLSQNNPSTAEEISKMAGKTTFKSYNANEKGAGEKDPVEKFFSIFRKKMSYSESWSSTEFLKPSFIMSMPENKHIVLVQDFMNRPILADTPKFWLEPEIASKVYNLFTGQGPKPCPPMPIDQAAGAARERQRMEEAEKELRAHNDTAKPADNRYMVVATPRDIQSLTRDARGELLDRGKLFAAAEIVIMNNDGFVDLPEDENILVTSDLSELASFVGDREFFIFDEHTLEEEINSELRRQGQSLSGDRAHYINARAAEIGETPADSIYQLGYDGWVGLDVPSKPDDVTPQFAVTWITELVSFIASVEADKRTFMV